MIRGNVQWVPRDDRIHQFVATSGSGHGVVFDDLEGGMGPTPLETVALALGGCMAYDVVTILKKKRQEILRYEVRVEAEQQLGPPAVFAACHVHHVVHGRGVNPESVRQAIELSQRKYCAVGAMLSKTAPIRTSFEVIELVPEAVRNEETSPPGAPSLPLLGPKPSPQPQR
jgi:putative redox protein